MHHSIQNPKGGAEIPYISKRLKLAYKVRVQKLQINTMTVWCVQSSYLNKISYFANDDFSLFS